MDTGCLLKRCEMKRFFFFFLLLVILTAPPIASSFSSNFTAEDIWENAQKVVKVFNNEPYGNYAILENDKKVGVVARKEGQLTIEHEEVGRFLIVRIMDQDQFMQAISLPMINLMIALQT